MPAVCSVCTSPDRTAIDKALVVREPLRHIAGRFGTTPSSLLRHSKSHIPALLAQAQAVQKAADAAVAERLESRVTGDLAHALDLQTELVRGVRRMNMLFDACDEWLRDPENAEKYDIGPRGEDISVIVWEDVPGQPGVRVQKKRKMTYLLDKLETGGVMVERWESKHADPRDLVIKTKESLQSSLEFFAKMIGQLDERPVVNILVAPEWLALRAVIMAALMPYPDARAAVIDQLREVRPA